MWSRSLVILLQIFIGYQNAYMWYGIRLWIGFYKSWIINALKNYCWKCSKGYFCGILAYLKEFTRSKKYKNIKFIRPFSLCDVRVWLWSELDLDLLSPEERFSSESVLKSTETSSYIHLSLNCLFQIAKSPDKRTLQTWSLPCVVISANDEPWITL